VGQRRTCCETKQFKGPTSAKIPICAESQDHERDRVERKKKVTYAGDVVDDAVDDLALERLEHDGAIARDELGLAVAGEDHALADVGDGDDGDDEAELSGAGALDVGVELGLEVLLHARSEVGRVQHDRVRELFLGGDISLMLVRMRGRRRGELR